MYTHEAYTIHIHIEHTHKGEAMSKTIAIVNRRGGVGKTATTHALGAGLAHRGYKVLFIDLDSQCNLTFDVGANKAPLTSLEVLTGTATAQEAIQHTEGGDIIPASPSLATADTVLDGTGKEYRLKEALDQIAGDYDYIVIDTPPALGVLTINALTACERCIIPAQAEIHSLQGIGLLHEAIEAVKKYTNPALEIEGILITRYNGRAILSKDMRENLEGVAGQLKTRVFDTPIRECIAVKEAQATQTDIYTYSPKSNATQDYNAFIDAILKGVT